MSDAVSRAAVLDILSDEGWLGDSLRRIHALPAVQPDAREAALREAVNGLRKAAEDLDGYVGRGYGDEYLELADSLALSTVHPAHVNETPKSEHDARNMLTPATKGERDD